MTDWNILRTVVGEKALDEPVLMPSERQAVGSDIPLPVQLRLARYGVETRCPIEGVERRRGVMRARYVVRVPVFPGYLFARASDMARAQIDDDGLKGVIGWLLHEGELARVPDALVCRYMENYDTAERKTVHALFEPGAIVSVTDDVWEGFDMVVVEDGGPSSDSIEVEAELFGSRRKVTVRKSDVEKVA